MTRPEIKWNANFVPGLAAVALFVLLARATANLSVLSQISVFPLRSLCNLFLAETQLRS
jgi:hypothetical protein